MTKAAKSSYYEELLLNYSHEPSVVLRVIRSVQPSPWAAPKGVRRFSLKYKRIFSVPNSIRLPISVHEKL